MIALRAAVGKRKVRTDEAAPYYLGVMELLERVPVADRDQPIWARLEPLRVEALRDDVAGRGGVLRLATSQSTYGTRYWIACPKCGRRCGGVYWVGHGEAGRWACGKCAGVQSAAAALRRTLQGDRLILSGELKATESTRAKAAERERRRAERAAQRSGGECAKTTQPRPAR